MNLISFPALPGDCDYYSVENIFGSLGDNLIGVFGEGRAFVNWPENGLIGSLTQVAQDEGYWVMIYDFPDTLIIYDAVPISYDGLDNFCEPCTDCNNGEVEYCMHYGNNLISYPFQTSQDLDVALGEAADNVYALAGEGIAALNCDSNEYCNEDWVGSLQAFEGKKGYWLIALNDFCFTFNGTEEGLARIAHQPAVRPVPETHRFMQSSRQAFYFIESATIYGKALDIDDIIIAYNGDVVVGARYWNGEYTDVPAMGMVDDYRNIEGYCKSGDRISFKVWDASVNELIDMETDIETTWNDLSMSVINIMEVLPDDFSLDKAYPNPFNPTTTLNFALPIEAQVSITIYNLQGREVVSLINGNIQAGYHSVVWNADNHSSGVYFVKMVAGDYIHNQKIMLVK